MGKKGRYNFTKRHTKRQRRELRDAKSLARLLVRAQKYEGNHVPFSPLASPEREQACDPRSPSPLPHADPLEEPRNETGVTALRNRRQKFYHKGERDYYRVEVSARKRGVWPCASFLVEHWVDMQDFLGDVLRRLYDNFDGSHHAILRCGDVSTTDRPSDECWSVSGFVKEAGQEHANPVHMKLTSNLYECGDGTLRDMRVDSKGPARVFVPLTDRWPKAE